MPTLQLTTQHIKSSARHKKASDIRRTDLIVSAYRAISKKDRPYTLTHSGETCSLGIASN